MTDSPLSSPGRTGLVFADTAALVLAGGLARRMGGRDKGLLTLGGAPLARLVADRLGARCARVVVSANRHPEEYRRLELRPLPDLAPGFPGPLAGWQAACHELTEELVVSAPCDCPFFPEDLVERLRWALLADPGLTAVAARAAGRPQPVFAALRRRAAAGPLGTYLSSGGRGVGQWLASVSCRWVDFPDLSAFRNINDPDELAAAESSLRSPSRD